MDTEETRQDVEPQLEEQEPHLTIAQAVGMMVLLAILQLLLSLFLSKSAIPALSETSWANLSITHAISGLLTAEAGAILSGFSLLALLVPRSGNLAGVISLLIGVFGLSILSSEFGNLLQWIEPISESYLEAFNTLFQQNILGVFLAVGIIAPITEELIFRGVMLEGLRIRYSLKTAILVSTLLFALVHVFPWVILNAFLLGLFFSFLKLQTGSLLPCMIAHSLYNSLPFLLYRLLSFEIPGYTTMPGEKVQFQPWWFDLLGVALLGLGCAGIRFFWKTSQKQT